MKLASFDIDNIEIRFQSWFLTSKLSLGLLAEALEPESHWNLLDQIEQLESAQKNEKGLRIVLLDKLVGLIPREARTEMGLNIHWKRPMLLLGLQKTRKQF